MDPNNSQSTNPTPTTAGQPTSTTEQNQPANPANAPTPDQKAEAPDYIEEVGGDMIGLLDEINEDDALVQKVATEMELDKDKVKSILTPLLNKIDQGQITVEEIALIMASTVVDEEDTQTQGQETK